MTKRIVERAGVESGGTIDANLGTLRRPVPMRLTLSFLFLPRATLAALEGLVRLGLRARASAESGLLAPALAPRAQAKWMRR